MTDINTSGDRSIPQTSLTQQGIPHPKSVRTPDKGGQSSGNHSAHVSTDSISCGLLPSLTSLKTMPRKASSRWKRFWNGSNTKSKNGVESNNAESPARNRVPGNTELTTTISDSLTTPSEEDSPQLIGRGIVERLNAKSETGGAPSNKIDPSDLGSLHDSDFDKRLHERLSRSPNEKELDDLAETAGAHWPNKRKFILDQEETSSYALLCLFKDASSDDILRIFSHQTFPKLSEHALFHVIKHVKNIPLTELQRLEILNHENAEEDVFSEFLRKNLPHNVTKRERLAIERSTRASMKNLTILYKTLPENDEDALEEMIAIIMNPNVIGGVVNREGDVVVEPILEHLPFNERMKIIRDPKTSAMIITFLVQRLTLSKMKMQDFKPVEYKEELNAIIDSQNICDDDLMDLVPDVSRDSRDKRKDMINHRNVGELSLPLLAEDASEDECGEIWNRTLDIGSKIRSDPKSILSYNFWKTWTALLKNPDCPKEVKNQISLIYAQNGGSSNANILRWQSQGAQ